MLLVLEKFLSEGKTGTMTLDIKDGRVKGGKMLESISLAEDSVDTDGHSPLR
jgi:hypothetical protein